jgi:hypothetical protein
VNLIADELEARGLESVATASDGDIEKILDKVGMVLMANARG